MITFHDNRGPITRDGSPLAAEAAPIGMVLRTSCYWHCRRPFLITFQSFVLHSEVPFLWSFLTSASLVSAHNVCLSLLPAFFRRLCYRCCYYCMCRRNSTVVINTIFSYCYQRVHSVISDRLSHLTCLQHVDKFKSGNTLLMPLHRHHCWRSQLSKAPCAATVRCLSRCIDNTCRFCHLRCYACCCCCSIKYSSLRSPTPRTFYSLSRTDLPERYSVYFWVESMKTVAEITTLTAAQTRTVSDWDDHELYSGGTAVNLSDPGGPGRLLLFCRGCSGGGGGGNGSGGGQTSASTAWLRRVFRGSGHNSEHGTRKNNEVNADGITTADANRRHSTL